MKSPGDTMTTPNQEIYDELYDDHWRHCYNWGDLNEFMVADRYNCSIVVARRVMKWIEINHPKPKQKNAAGEG